MAARGYGQWRRPDTTQVVTVGAASAKTTNPVGAHTMVVRLVADTDCHVTFGPTGDAATTSDMFLPTDQPELFQIGAGEYVHVIQNAAGGNLYVTEMV